MKRIERESNAERRGITRGKRNPDAMRRERIRCSNPGRGGRGKLTFHGFKSERKDAHVALVDLAHAKVA